MAESSPYLRPQQLRTAPIRTVYSVAYEDDQGRGYTGTKNTHPVLDLNVSSCSDAVYQTMWLIWTSDASEWVEIGTAYFCSTVANFAYYCDPPSCGFVQLWYDPTEGAHSFKIERENGDHDVYDLIIDGDLVQKVGYTRYATALTLSAGLESTLPNKVVAAHSHYSLRKKRWDGDFVDWAGKDRKSVTNPPMCGFWNSATSWRAGENTTC